MGALVYYATAIPWEFPGFGVGACFDALLALHDQWLRGEPLVMREHRFLLVARRPPAQAAA